MIIKNPGKRHIGVFDVHVPHESNLKNVLLFIKDYKPDYLVVGGDFLDCQWASHWNDKAFKRIGFDKLRAMHREEYLAGREVLSTLRKAAPRSKIIYIPGNHEDWICKAAYYYPQLGITCGLDLSAISFKDDLNALMQRELRLILERELQTEKMKIKVLDYNEPLKIGKLYYLHGHQFGGQRPTVTSARRYPGENMVFGHHHTHEVTPIYNQGDPRQTHEHVAVPCLSRLGPGYLKDKSTRWINGFWAANFAGNGLFDGRVVKVMDGQIIR